MCPQPYFYLVKVEMLFLMDSGSSKISKSSMESKYSSEEVILKIKEKRAVATTNNMVIEVKEIASNKI